MFLFTKEVQLLIWIMQNLQMTARSPYPLTSANDTFKCSNCRAFKYIIIKCIISVIQWHYSWSFWVNVIMLKQCHKSSNCSVNEADYCKYNSMTKLTCVPQSLSAFCGRTQRRIFKLRSSFESSSFFSLLWKPWWKILCCYTNFMMVHGGLITGISRQVEADLHTPPLPNPGGHAVGVLC